MSLWMNTGTVAVTLNSKKITGTGTAFSTSAIPARPGQPIVISNVIYEIERVESDTVLWLATNYLGASATGVKYSIMTTMEGSFNDLGRRAAQVMGAYQGYMDVYEALFTGTGNVTVTLPDGSIVTLPAWGNLQPKDATLSAMAGVATAADKLLYFNGVDTSAATPFTAFARALLADANSTAARTTLGAAPAGYGIGERTLALVPDMNVLLPPGWYHYNADAGSIGGPAGVSYGILLVSGDKDVSTLFSGWTGQLLFANRGAIYTRNQVSVGSMSGSIWRKVYTQTSIVGGVSQSGGVPAGAIIERGVNANGDYTKYADGTMECFRRIETSTNVNSATSGIYFGPAASVMAMPVTFIATPVINVQITASSTVWGGIAGLATASQWPNVYPLSDQPWGSDHPAQLHYYAIGRWY